MRAAPVLIAALLGAVGTRYIASDTRSRRPIPGGAVRAGSLSFDGYTTLGDFTGHTSTVTGQVTSDGTMASTRGWVEAPVRTLLTGNHTRDTHLNESLESDTYPTIRYELTSVQPGEVQGDTTAVVLNGYMAIHGVRQAVAIAATVVNLRDGVRVRGVTPLNLKTYKIGGLTRLFGMLTMHDEILMHFDLTFAP